MGTPHYPIITVAKNDPFTVFGTATSPHFNKFYSFGELGTINVGDKGCYLGSGPGTKVSGEGGFKFDRYTESIYNAPYYWCHNNWIGDGPPGYVIPGAPGAWESGTDGSFPLFPNFLWGGDDGWVDSIFNGDIRYRQLGSPKCRFLEINCASTAQTVRGYHSFGRVYATEGEGEEAVDVKTLKCQGFRAQLYTQAGEPGALAALIIGVGGILTTAAPKVYFKVTISRALRKIYVSRCELVTTDTIADFQLDDPWKSIAWKYIGEIPTAHRESVASGGTAGSAGVNSPTGFAVLDVMYVNHVLEIALDGGEPVLMACPYETTYDAETGVPVSDYRYITDVAFSFKNTYKAYINVSPWVYREHCWLATPEEPLGFLPTVPQMAGYQMYHRMAPCDLAVNDAVAHYVTSPAGNRVVTGEMFTMELHCDLLGSVGAEPAAGFSWETLPILNMGWVIPGDYDQGTSTAVPVETHGVGGKKQVRSAEVTYSFDINNLNISTDASITLDNRHGLNTGHWDGLCSLGIEMGLGNLAGEIAMEPVFVGYGGIDVNFSRQQAPEGVVTISGMDCSYPLKTSQIHSMPWLDGWCHFSALRFVAELAGIHPDQFSDAEVPKCADPFTCEHYHLPMGNGGSPRMKFADGTTFWTVMNAIRENVGYLLFFDHTAWPKLRYIPWLGTDGAMAPSATNIFYDVPPDDSSAFNVMENLRVGRSLSSVNSDFCLVGINEYGPSFAPIVAQKTNLVAGVGPAYGAKSYLGFRRHGVWADSRFGTLAYAELGAEKIWDVVSKVRETISFSTRLCPYIEPLMWIEVVESYAGASGSIATSDSWFVTRATHRVVATQGGFEGSSQITAFRIIE